MKINKVTWVKYLRDKINNQLKSKKKWIKSWQNAQKRLKVYPKSYQIQNQRKTSKLSKNSLKVKI